MTKRTTGVTLEETEGKVSSVPGLTAKLITGRPDNGERSVL